MIKSIKELNRQNVIIRGPHCCLTMDRGLVRDHQDHLEVFDKRTDWKGVANFDGTMNVEKTMQGQKDPRQRLQER